MCWGKSWRCTRNTVNSTYHLCSVTLGVASQISAHMSMRTQKMKSIVKSESVSEFSKVYLTIFSRSVMRTRIVKNLVQVVLFTFPWLSIIAFHLRSNIPVSRSHLSIANNKLRRSPILSPRISVSQRCSRRSWLSKCAKTSLSPGAWNCTKFRNYGFLSKNDFATLSIRQSKREVLSFCPRLFQYCARDKFDTWVFLDNPYNRTGS